MNTKVIAIFTLLFTANFAGYESYAPLPSQCGDELIGNPCSPNIKCCTGACDGGKCAAGANPMDCCKPKKELPPDCSLPLIGAACDKDGKCCHGACKYGKCEEGTTKPLDCCIPPPKPSY